jgi:salicylate hydroxylase
MILLYGRTKRLDVPADPAAVISDPAAWSTPVVKLSRLPSLYNGLNCWAIFDLGDHLLSTYSKGRICITGDVAHAR